MDRKDTQTSDLQLTDKEVEWICNSNNKNSMADTDDSEWITDTDGCKGSVKVIEVIELDIPKRCELSVADN